MHHAGLCAVIFLLFSPLSAQESKSDLSDRACQGQLLVAVIDGAHVYAACRSSGSERIMEVSVNNMAGAEVGPLRDFSIGFCGSSVIAASAPEGWISKVEGDERQSVTWSLPDGLVATLGIPSHANAKGFLIRLKPGWRRSRSDSAWWGDSKIVAQSTIHDC